RLLNWSAIRKWPAAGSSLSGSSATAREATATAIVMTAMNGAACFVLRMTRLPARRDVALSSIAGDTSDQGGCRHGKHSSTPALSGRRPEGHLADEPRATACRRAGAPGSHRQDGGRCRPAGRGGAPAYLLYRLSSSTAFVPPNP